MWYLDMDLVQSKYESCGVDRDTFLRGCAADEDIYTLPSISDRLIVSQRDR